MNIVLVHGAWHSGPLLEPVADALRALGHRVWLPTLAGNAPGDRRDTGLAEAVASLEAYLVERDLDDLVLIGHSYAGMVLSALADGLAPRLRRLVYWNAFVPEDGECLADLVPAAYRELFERLVDGDGGVMLPFNVWREQFMNDASEAQARRAWERLNPHPYASFTEPVRLARPMAAVALPKSYVNATEDTALPASLPWHPRLSERLGLYRLVQLPGSHEVCFTAPERLAEALDRAARD